MSWFVPVISVDSISHKTNLNHEFDSAIEHDRWPD